jgi:hypothetical protein
LTTVSWGYGYDSEKTILLPPGGAARVAVIQEEASASDPKEAASQTRPTLRAAAIEAARLKPMKNPGRRVAHTALLLRRNGGDGVAVGRSAFLLHLDEA